MMPQLCSGDHDIILGSKIKYKNHCSYTDRKSDLFFVCFFKEHRSRLVLVT